MHRFGVVHDRDRRSRPSVAADRTISLSRAKPSHKALTLAAEVDASAWPGCNFNFHKFCVHSMGQSWRVQGEYLFGGTGTLTAVGGRFDPTCDWPGETYGNRLVSRQWPPSAITGRRLTSWKPSSAGLALPRSRRCADGPAKARVGDGCLPPRSRSLSSEVVST
jgi:hypothetical protein